MEVYTIGHSTLSLEEFTTLLRGAGVARIVDVRAFPMSRRHPQFNKEALSITLPAGGLDYRHMPALGGRRQRQKGKPSRNGLWKVEAFRNYADYAETAAFGLAITELEALAREQPTAFMCAEAVWWQCHRRLISDYLMARGWTVIHILSAEQQQRHSMTEGARVHSDGSIEYPPPQPSML